MTSAVTVRLTGDGLELAGDWWEPIQPRRGTVVLLHGGGQTRHSWHRAGETLSERGWATLAYDARGHGESDWSAEEDYATETMSRDLEAIIERLDEPPVLVGASMGGNTALALAGRRPELCRALVLVDIVPRTADAGVERIIAFMEARPDGYGTLEEVSAAVADYKGTAPSDDRWDGLRKNVRLQDGRWQWHWDPSYIRYVRRQPRRAATELLERAAAAVTAPTLVLRAERSDVVGEREVEAFLARMPSATVVEVPEAGHTVGGDENSTFVAALTRFLGVTFPVVERAIRTER
jgi:pimeloyl-ACP methyl ester carboxylesterase